MIDEDALHVWHEEQLVGYLWQDAHGRMGFRYDEGWLTTKGAFPVSISLPLIEDEFAPATATAHRFFANLLPEGGVRTRIAREFGISDNDFELLRAIGGECAGALTILPDTATPTLDDAYRPLGEEELERIASHRGRIHPSTPSGQRPRLSLAGAQDKVPIRLEGNRFLLPEQAAATTHILKFEVAEYRNVPAYEVYTTWLARAVGLPTVDIELKRIGGHACSLTRRYDRIETGGHILRLHQEDLCQALGRGHSQKYESDQEGARLWECYRVTLDHSSLPVEDGRRLVEWQLFNLLAGNSDGHAKNLSLLYDSPTGDLRLAPFYDLVCTRAIEHLERRLAFSIGGESDPGHIGPDHWRAMAEELDMRPRYLHSLIERMSDALPGAAEETYERFTECHGEYPAIEERILPLVRKQCAKIRKLLEPIGVFREKGKESRPSAPREA